MRFINAGIIAAVLLGKHAMAGSHHGHFHKRAVDIITDWDIIYATVTDVVWVTITGDDGSVTTAPAAVANVQTTATTTASSVPSPAAAIVSTAAVVQEAPVSSPVAAVVSSVIAAIPSSVIAGVPSAVVPVVSAPVAVAPVVQTTLATVVSVAQASSIASTVETSSSAAATVAFTSSSTSKRGLSYNDASLLDPFTGSANINWCYNWASTTEGTVPSGLEFVPMLWGLESDATSDWNTNAKAAVASGSTALLAFNEPDNPGQSNISPSDAAAGYIQYMNPLSGSAQLGAPAVTNGGGSTGLQWLEDFMSACDGNCDIDFVPIHWYDSASNYAYFKDHVQQAYVAGGNRTLWITEFGATGSDAEVVNFLEIVMPWLDQQEYVGRYAYFMDDIGVLLESVGDVSDIGNTFMDFTSSTINSLIADAS